MTFLVQVNFSEFSHVNYLWPRFVENLGLEKAQKAVHQAIDLQRMNASHTTLPVLLFETCGVALVSIDLIHRHTGIFFKSQDIILILSNKKKLLQLLSKI